MADENGNIEKSNINKRPRKNKAGEKMAEFTRQEKQASKNNCSKAESDMQDSGHESTTDTRTTCKVLHMPEHNNNNFGVTTRLIGLLIILRKLLMQAQIHWFPMSNYCNEKPRIKSSIKSSSKQNRN